MPVVGNERIKLLAAALNGVAISSVTVGLLTPLAAVFYNLGGFRRISFGRHAGDRSQPLAFGRHSLTFRGKIRARRSTGMSSVELLAFVIMPITVMALGWCAVFVHQWFAAREHRAGKESG